MGAERFFNIKCRVSGLKPDAAVVVATVRALKSHSGKYKVVAGRPLPEEMLEENPDDVTLGAANLRKQLENIRAHGVDAGRRDQRLPERLRSPSTTRSARSPRPWASGRRSAPTSPTAAAAPPRSPRRSPRRRASRTTSSCLYPAEAPLKEKIETIATKVYGADGVDYSPLAAASSTATSATASATCRSASPRPTCRISPRPRPSRARRPAGGCRSARSARQRRRRLHLPDLRRHAHHAGPGQQPGGGQHRPRRDGNIVGLY